MFEIMFETILYSYILYIRYKSNLCSSFASIIQLLYLLNQSSFNTCRAFDLFFAFNVIQLHSLPFHSNWVEIFNRIGCFRATNSCDRFFVKVYQFFNHCIIIRSRGSNKILISHIPNSVHWEDAKNLISNYGNLENLEQGLNNFSICFIFNSYSVCYQFSIAFVLHLYFICISFLLHFYCISISFLIN